MKTLKELYWQDCDVHSKRIEVKKNRKGMIYAAKYYDIPASQFNYDIIRKELNAVGVIDLPQRHYIPVGENGTLVVIHVTEKSKLWEGCKQIGYEESEAA